MSGILSGLRIVEGSAFVAAPLGGMTLAQLGADVIRYDPIGGGLDHGRWPLAPDGQSLFWAGLNKGKRSIQIDLRAPEGQELVARIITAPGENAGIFLTNLPPRGALAYEALKARRPDVIMVQLTGNPDGSSEVDYTVNPAAGFLSVTGPRGNEEPVNAVLPAWDIAMGEMAAVGVLAADRHRRLTGVGTLVNLALSDVAFAAAAALGRLAQAELGTVAERDGNNLYGAFGRDFATADGRRIMLVGLTTRQWKALTLVTGLDVGTIEEQTGMDLLTESGRYTARDAIAEALAPWVAARTLAELATILDAAAVSWGPYRSFAQMLSEDPRVSPVNPMFSRIAQPGIGSILAAGSPLSFSVAERLPPRPAPQLGEHTDEILAEAGLSSGEIAVLHDRKIVAGPKPG
ncbi:MAG: CoA transferase [Devosia sp.]